MNGNLAVDYNNAGALWHDGIRALTKELGPVGMAYFLRQFGQGHGDYTAERDALLSGIGNGDVKKDLGL